ncbi:MAG TPA: histidinol-phosphate transaminase [Gammaproteobacteria bacterium]|nr:histidinol-phosphate transaminase [Gammaproteobacteria bacterium]
MSKLIRAAQWVREDVQAQKSYHIPEASDVIKLDAMENPWSMPAELDEAWRNSLAGIQLNRYPDPVARELHAPLRELMQVPEDASLLLGNGSDEIIQFILMSLSAPDRVAMAPSPSFVMYEVLARACCMKFAAVPLDKNFALDMPAMRQAISRYQPAVIFLAWPNNPTGNLFDIQDVKEILSLAPGLVVIDEAYQPFVGISFMTELMDHPNLVVMRTLSKVGLAGLRLGILAGHSEWLNEFDKLRLPYNINSLTQTTASFALQHWDVFQQQIDAICKERERMLGALQNIPGITAWPSQTNFILFRVADGLADDLHAHLLVDGILIKNLNRPGSPLSNCLRVTIGLADENDAFVASVIRFTHPH